jgi:cobalt-zinc-cadmium resistance protein CzcA
VLDRYFRSGNLPWKLRAGLIVASAIPLSLLFALGMMNVFGVSANLMSLGYRFWVDCRWSCDHCRSHFAPFGSKSTQAMTQSEMDEEVFLSASKIKQCGFWKLSSLLYTFRSYWQE